MGRANFLREAAGGLADGLEPVKRRRLDDDIVELLASVRTSLANQLDPLEDVEQRILVATQRLTASASTASRRRGFTNSIT